MSISGGVITMAVLFLSGKILVADHLWQKYGKYKTSESKKEAPGARPVEVPINEENQSDPKKSALSPKTPEEREISKKNEILMRKFNL